MDADRQVPQQDLAADYQQRVTDRRGGQDVAEMEDFLNRMNSGQEVTAAPVAPADPTRPLPQPKPLIRKTDDPLGRLPTPDDKKSSGVSRNLAEIPGAAIAGVESAISNAFGWAIDPLADWLNENVANLSYDRKIQTPTGNLTKSVTEFLTGFVPAIKGLRALGHTGKILAPAAAGAFADFVARDPSSGRLADLWKQAGLPDNILTDYLASKPEDSQMEARFKNALEGVGLGVMVEGIVLGARAIKAARGVKGAKQTETAYLKDKYGELTDEDFLKIVGDPSKPSVEMVVHKPSPVGKKIKEGLELTKDVSPRSLVKGDNGQQEVYINFARFDEPDAVKNAIGQMADIAKTQIDEATRGVITQKETERLAQNLGMTVTQLLERRKGQPFNAEEAVAARQLWAASGERLVELAKIANSKNAGAIDQYAFRKQLAVHAAIQAEVIGARTETARALASWSIPVKGGNIEKARAIDQIMNAMGGQGASKEMARRLAILAENNADPAAIAAFARKGVFGTSVDAIKEVWINGLLSSPKTHIVNTMSNTLTAATSIGERLIAGGIRSLSGGEGVRAAEAAAMTYGLVTSVKEAFRMSAKALRTGETSWSFNKVDLPKTHPLSAEAFGMDSESMLGKMVDFVGTAARVPTRLLGAEDEFFKTIGYRMELHAQALRQAMSEGHVGEAMGRRMAEIVQNPPEHIMINSADAALYNTFTNEIGWFGSWIMRGRNREGIPGMAMSLVLPFVRTPVNIARYAFERSPFAPLVGQWRADIAAGGARADLALARMSTGTSIMLVAMDMADAGLITGSGFRGKDTPEREALERQGWMPNSIKVGDRWYSYNRTDPLGMTLGFAANIAEAVKKGEIDEEEVDEWYEVIAMSVAAVSSVVVNKTYLEGISNIVEVAHEPRRHTQKYVNDLIASFVPMTSLDAAVKNLFDPTAREASSPVEAVMARIAGLSEKLPPKRTLWGAEMTNESGFGKAYDFLSPIASKQIKDSPIDREMVRLNHGMGRIQKRTTFDGVNANMRLYPRAYDDYVRLAGNDMKHPAWGLGAKDYLDAVVSGKHPMSAAYKALPSDESRSAFIHSTITEYRKLAQQEVLKDPKHSGFAAEIGRLKQLQLRSKTGIDTIGVRG